MILIRVAIVPFVAFSYQMLAGVVIKGSPSTNVIFLCRCDIHTRMALRCFNLFNFFSVNKYSGSTRLQPSMQQAAKKHHNLSMCGYHLFDTIYIKKKKKRVQAETNTFHCTNIFLLILLLLLTIIILQKKKQYSK